MNDFEPQNAVDPADIVPADVAAGHEPIEVIVRPIFVFAAALAALTVVVMLGLAAMMRGFSAAEKADGTTTAELVIDRGDFPAPRLQRSTTYDMAEFRAQEDAALASYGWEDRRAGIARIPIDRAMDLLVKNGLPKAKPQQPPDTNPKPKEMPVTPPSKPTTDPSKKE